MNPALTTADMLSLVRTMPPGTRTQLDALLLASDPSVWVPQDGPQSMAYHSLADVVFYGGSAGGGKTDLLLGLSLLVWPPVEALREE